MRCPSELQENESLVATRGGPIVRFKRTAESIVVTVADNLYNSIRVIPWYYDVMTELDLVDALFVRICEHGDCRVLWQHGDRVEVLRMFLRPPQ